MTTINSHHSTTSETTTSNPTKQRSGQHQNATTKIHKTYKTNAHPCITISGTGPSRSVTSPGRLAAGVVAPRVDLGGWC